MQASPLTVGLSPTLPILSSPWLRSSPGQGLNCFITRASFMLTVAQRSSGRLRWAPSMWTGAGVSWGAVEGVGRQWGPGALAYLLLQVLGQLQVCAGCDSRMGALQAGLQAMSPRGQVGSPCPLHPPVGARTCAPPAAPGVCGSAQPDVCGRRGRPGPAATHDHDAPPGCPPGRSPGRPAARWHRARGLHPLRAPGGDEGWARPTGTPAPHRPPLRALTAALRAQLCRRSAHSSPSRFTCSCNRLFSASAWRSCSWLADSTCGRRRPEPGLGPGPAPGCRGEERTSVCTARRCPAARAASRASCSCRPRAALRAGSCRSAPAS